MKKIWKSLVLAVFLCLVAVPVHAKVSAGSSATGASIPKYQTVKTVLLDANNEKMTMSRQLYVALQEAGENASSSVQYKIIIPPGTYEQTHTFEIASNTYIYARDTVWNKTNTSNTLFVTLPGQTYKNFVLDGGVWDSSATDNEKTANASMVRFAHMKNVVIKNATFRCNRGGHIIEVGDINNMTISNCTLSGNSLYKNVQPMEAVQLDVCVQASMDSMTPYNGKGCHNVVVSGNTFQNVSRGVGSHADGKEANSYTDITVKKNQFRNVEGQAVYAMFWKNCTIQNNTAVNVHHAGIWCRSADGILVQNNSIRKVSAFSGERKKTYSGDQFGVLLTDSSNCTVKKNTLSNSKGKVTGEQGTCRNNTMKGNT